MTLLSGDIRFTWIFAGIPVATSSQCQMTQISQAVIATVAGSSHCKTRRPSNDTSDTILLASSHTNAEYQYQYWTL